MKHFRITHILIALLALAMLGLVGCGGDDEEEAASGVTLEALDQRIKGIEGYIAGQVVAKNEANERNAGIDGYVAPPVYALKRKKATENEQAIVLWMADCAVNSYLNPGLPDQVREREITKTENEMWEALEGGQYVSFQQFIGQAFAFCQATLVEDRG